MLSTMACEILMPACENYTTDHLLLLQSYSRMLYFIAMTFDGLYVCTTKYVINDLP